MDSKILKDDFLKYIYASKVKVKKCLCFDFEFETPGVKMFMTSQVRKCFETFWNRNCF